MPIVLDTHTWLWWVTKDRRPLRTRQSGHREGGPAGGQPASINFLRLGSCEEGEKGQLALDRPFG